MRKLLRFHKKGNQRTGSIEVLLSFSLGAVMLSCGLVSCVSQQPRAESKKVKKKKRERRESEVEDMLAAPNLTLGAAARKYVPASRFNEGTPLTDRDYVEAAELAIHQRDDNSSMKLATEALRLNPNSAAAYYVRGRARFGCQAGGEEAAINDLKRSIELSSGGRTTAGAWHYLARVYDAQKDFPRAIEAIAQSIKVRPEDHSAYKTQAAIYTANGKKEEAIDAYSRAIRLKPEDAEVFFQRAQLFETVKRYDQALEDYKACVSHGPAVNQMPYKLMSLKRRSAILSQRKNFREAADELSLALTMDKGDEELYRLRGEAYEHLHEFDKALVDYSKAISMAPEFSQRSYKARARCYEKLGKVERAAADLKESKRLIDAPAEKPLYELKGEGESAY